MGRGCGEQPEAGAADETQQWCFSSCWPRSRLAGQAVFAPVSNVLA